MAIAAAMGISPAPAFVGMTAGGEAPAAGWLVPVSTGSTGGLTETGMDGSGTVIPAGGAPSAWILRVIDPRIEHSAFTWTSPFTPDGSR